MSVATADLHKAIRTTWNASTLNASFRALRDNEVTGVVLTDRMGFAGEAFPYCVFEHSSGTTTDRMSNGASALSEIRDVLINFHVHARSISGDSRTSKEIAAFLGEEIMKVFGGHSTQAPASITLDNGNHLITQYQTDFGIWTGEDEYEWVVGYIHRLDIPVQVI